MGFGCWVFLVRIFSTFFWLCCFFLDFSIGISYILQAVISVLKCCTRRILNNKNVLDKGKKSSDQSTVWLEEKDLGDLICEGDSPQGCGVTETNALTLKYVNFTDE